MPNPKPPAPHPPKPSPQPMPPPGGPGRVEELLKPAEVAALARVSRALVYHWINTGRIAWVNLAPAGARPRIRIRQSAFEAFAAANERGVA